MNKLALAFVLAGFVAAPAFAAMKEKPVKVELAAQNGSGETGYAMLYPHGAKTKVIVHLKGTPKGVAQPDHIHKGTCANLDPKPAVHAQAGGGWQVHHHGRCFSCRFV
jgi:hypothetical protein